MEVKDNEPEARTRIDLEKSSTGGAAKGRDGFAWNGVAEDAGLYHGIARQHMSRPGNRRRESGQVSVQAVRNLPHGGSGDTLFQAQYVATQLGEDTREVGNILLATGAVDFLS
jgi:hypothetical protein